MRGAIHIDTYENSARGNREACYICPYCGGEVFAGERIYSPDSIQYVCPECFSDYLNDLSLDELCKLFNIDSKEAEEYES